MDSHRFTEVGNIGLEWRRRGRRSEYRCPFQEHVLTSLYSPVFSTLLGFSTGTSGEVQGDLSSCGSHVRTPCQHRSPRQNVYLSCVLRLFAPGSGKSEVVLYLCPSLPGSREVIGSGIRLLVFVYSRCLRLTIYACKEFVV